MAGIPIAVVIDPQDQNRWRVFHRETEDTTATLTAVDGRLVDQETGSVWDPVTGKSTEGRLAWAVLEVLPGVHAV